MVITRAQSTNSAEVKNTNMNDHSDTESDIGLPEFKSHNLTTENLIRHWNEQEREHERFRIERRFCEINRQISELTSLRLIFLKLPLVKVIVRMF